MSSSRSIATARARRSGEQTQMNQPSSRPVTSINSQAAFAQQPPQGRNVRITPGQYSQQPQMPQNIQQNIQQSSNNTPISTAKLSISDAIGLITLRLGRVEQHLMTQQDEGVTNNSSDNIPSFDKSVLSNIMLRLDSIEKKDNNNNTMSNDVVMRLDREVKEVKELLNRFMTNFDLHMVNYNNFVKETNDRFADYELAIADLEKNIYTDDGPNDCEMNIEDLQVQDVNDIDLSSENMSNEPTILSGDLKKIIKLELENSN